MIYSLQSIQTTTNTNQTIHSEAVLAQGLLSGLNKRLSEITIQKLKDLLIEYILANMMRHSAEKKAILTEIGNVLKAFKNGIQTTDKIEAKVMSMESSPHRQDQNYLQHLIQVLKEDISSGNTDNLSLFIQHS